MSNKANKVVFFNPFRKIIKIERIDSINPKSIFSSKKKINLNKPLISFIFDGSI